MLSGGFSRHDLEESGCIAVYRAIPRICSLASGKPSACRHDILEPDLKAPQASPRGSLEAFGRYRRDAERFYAARRFTLLSAMAVNVLSTAFSSSRFCCSKAAQSLRPNSFAQAINVP
jgi:hypothetical protein